MSVVHIVTFNASIIRRSLVTFYSVAVHSNIFAHVSSVDKPSDAKKIRAILVSAGCVHCTCPGAWYVFDGV